MITKGLVTLQTETRRGMRYRAAFWISSSFVARNNQIFHCGEAHLRDTVKDIFEKSSVPVRFHEPRFNIPQENMYGFQMVLQLDQKGQ
jgi:hypothetical protein